MAQKDRTVNSRAMTVYDRVYVVLTIIAVSTVIAPYLYTILNGNLPAPGLLSLLLPVTGVLLGYLLQSLFGHAFKVTRAADDNAYEKTTEFFKPSKAAAGITLSVIAGIAAGSLLKGYLMNVQTGDGSYYDRYSFIPYMFGAFIMLCMIAGVVLWFYPFNRVISVRTIVPLTIVFFINFVLLFFLGNMSKLFMTLCAFIFLTCAFILLNQSNVIKTFSSTKNTLATPSVRFYNIALILLVMLALCVILTAVLSCIVGITTLLKMAVKFALEVMFREDEVYEDAGELAQSFSDSVFNGVLDSFDVNGNAAKFFFLIFFVLILGVMVFFIISRRRDIWKTLKTAFTDFFAALMNLLVWLFTYRREKEETFIILDYKDEEIKMDAQSVRELRPSSEGKKKSYRDFKSRLDSLHGNAERIRYCYSSLVSGWRENNFGLSSGDTPREIRGKIEARTDDELEAITDAYESVEYAETNPDDKKADSAINGMCAILKKFYH